MYSDKKLPRSPSTGPDADFGGAVARFQQFLKADNYNERIVWVMPEDILTTGKRYIYIRVPIPAANEAKARRMYEEGLAQGRGLLMSTVCRMNASTYCYIWFSEVCRRSAARDLAPRWKFEIICKGQIVKPCGTANKRPLIVDTSKIVAPKKPTIEVPLA